MWLRPTGMAADWVVMMEGVWVIHSEPEAGGSLSRDRMEQGSGKKTM